MCALLTCNQGGRSQRPATWRRGSAHCEEVYLFPALGPHKEEKDDLGSTGHLGINMSLALG